MPLSLAELLASRDWYPSISTDGAVTGVVRFVDLDDALPADLSDLDARVCLVIGITSQAQSTTISAAADHLDLVLSTKP